LRQVDGDGEAAAHMVAVVRPPLGKLASQSHSGGAIRASWVPARSFPSGDRIDPFVDDRVLAIAFAGHVSLHDVLLRNRHCADR
jgi:hypothetical protein